MKIVLIAMAFVLSITSVAAESGLVGVVVKVDPPHVTRRTFDPKNPPKEMPTLTPPEVGTCVYSFGCSTEIVMRGERGRTARVTGVQVATRLGITLWTPQAGPPKILAHEEGHRAIAEMYYQLAEPVARRLAGQVLGKPVSWSTGRDEKAAETELKKIQDELIAEYLRETARRCDVAQAHFDTITQHSMDPIPESEAVASAIAEEEEGLTHLQPSDSRKVASESPSTSVRRPPTRPRR
jgi:hypothetical protein